MIILIDWNKVKSIMYLGEKLMFKYEEIKQLNDLEMLVYDYVMKNKKQITFMTVRELAAAVHVSTSTVVRFCKKMGCDGYAEFRVKFKMHLNESKEKKPRQDIDEILHYFEGVNTPLFEEKMQEAVAMIHQAKNIIFVGIGTSGVLGKYGARYFSNLRKYSQHIDDPYYPVLEDMYETTVVIALSVSGETMEIIQLVNRFKEHNCEVIAITNKAYSTLGRIADLTLSYFVSEQVTENKYNVTTQIPVLFLIEAMGRRL